MIKHVFDLLTTGENKNLIEIVCKHGNFVFFNHRSNYFDDDPVFTENAQTIITNCNLWLKNDHQCYLLHTNYPHGKFGLVMNFNGCTINGTMNPQQVICLKNQFDHVNFVDCRYNGGRFYLTTQNSCTYERCIFNETGFSETSMQHCTFSHTQFTNSNSCDDPRSRNYSTMYCLRFLGGKISHCIFDKVNLTQAKIQNSKVEDSIITNTNLSGANFSGTTFTNVKLEKVKLCGTLFTGSIFRGECIISWKQPDEETTPDAFLVRELSPTRTDNIFFTINSISNDYPALKKGLAKQIIDWFQNKMEMANQRLDNLRLPGALNLLVLIYKNYPNLESNPYIQLVDDLISNLNQRLSNLSSSNIIDLLNIILSAYPGLENCPPKMQWLVDELTKTFLDKNDFNFKDDIPTHPTRAYLYLLWEWTKKNQEPTPQQATD